MWARLVVAIAAGAAVACAPAPPRVTELPPPALRAGGTPQVTLDEARRLFPDAPRGCARIECLIEGAYARDPKAQAIALARSWKALVHEFFGGRDLVPAC
ncbi:MAG TPA: hypothetical protein VK932_03620 [Kofleriaceae bacterium]|nr:hypothetical protein [Kofleriaceae bacterium]